MGRRTRAYDLCRSHADPDAQCDPHSRCAKGIDFELRSKRSHRDPDPLAHAELGGLVRRGMFTSQTLTPKKMAVISTWTREMGDHSIPAIEGLIREAIQQDTSVAIDTVLIDANPATTIRPAGLLNGVAATTATAGGGLAAFIGDITALIGAVTTSTY